MPVATKKEVKLGRKRLYPEGSIEYRFHVPPDVEMALKAFMNRQSVKPEPRAVFLTALTRFLVAEGDLNGE